MDTSRFSLEQLSEKLGGKLWIKGDLKRIYLDRGYNTKKMTTQTYVFEKNGGFRVNCFIECPSQNANWIKSQQQEVIDGVMADIERALFELANPDADYADHLEAIEAQAEVAQKASAVQQLHARKQDIDTLSIDNVDEFLNRYYDLGMEGTIWHIRYQKCQLDAQSRYLFEKDEYPPLVYSHTMERTYQRSEKKAAETWMAPLGDVKVGETVLHFRDEVVFSFLRFQGKRKIVFAPMALPQHVTDRLNKQLEIETEKRRQHLIAQVAYHTEELAFFIQKYKDENAD